MYFQSLLPVAALALTANAFLVPPEVPHAAAIDSGVFDVATTLSASNQALELDCQDCHAAVGKHGVIGYQAAEPEKGMKMSVEMKFAVQDGTLTLNDAPIYPPPNPRAGPIMYTARQIVSGPTDRYYGGALPLSVSIELEKTRALKGSDGSLKIHPIKVEAIGLGQFPVHVPTVHVKLAELDNGELKMLPLTTTKYQHQPLVDSCASILCRAKAILVTKLAALRAAAAAKMGALRGCYRKGPANAEQFRGKVHGHHSHHRHGGFRGVAGRMMRHILLPVLLGIFTGAFVGAVAMIMFAAGRAIVRRVRGGQRGAYVPVGADDAEEGRASSDEPPKYEDHAYVEAEEDVTSEKKELLPEQRN